ncbi:MAG: ParB/RepB/Spo0J family partition protein [Thermomicrobiales bacterium]
MATPEPRRGRAKRHFTVDALFTDTRPQAAGVDDLIDAKLIPVQRIVGDPDQPRRSFDSDRLEELADSIRQQGILQPIVVRYEPGDDIYVIVHGERRWRAAQLAGTAALPALVRDVPVERRLIHQLTENVIRDDLNAVDRANALRQLKDILGDAPWEHVAAAVGIRRSRIFQLLGTGKLSAETRAEIQQGRLSEKQSRALQGMPPIKEAAFRQFLIEESLPESATVRLARAFRDLPIATGTPDAVYRALIELRELLLPKASDGIRNQTSTLLRAISRAASGTTPDRRRLSQLGKLVGSPSFDDTRFTREIANVTRMLVRVPSEPNDRPEDVTVQLRELRDTLTALLADANEKGGR